MQPGQKKGQTFRGEHRSPEWEETVERFYLFELICVLWRRILFQISGKMAKFVLKYANLCSGTNRSGFKQVGIVAARDVGM